MRIFTASDLRTIENDEQALVDILTDRNADIDYETLAGLASHPSYRVRGMVAKHPNADIDILRKLADDTSPDVLMAVARNPYADTALLLKLWEHPLGPVRWTSPLLPGLFSVSPTKRVRFARGNVRRRREYENGDPFRIAECQYAMPKEDDLLEWNAPGLTEPAEKVRELTLANRGDWGYCFCGGVPWRMMTADECDYLLKDRADAASKLGYATVENVTGLILLPDEFSDPKVNTSSKATGGAFVPRATTGYDTNVYETDTWHDMENAGAVFLPAGGWRDGATVLNAGEFGYYWLSSASGTVNAHYLSFNDNGVRIVDSCRCGKESVRLIADEELEEY